MRAESVVEPAGDGRREARHEVGGDAEADDLQGGLLDTADDILATATTDASGHYTVGGLPGGAARVSYAAASLPVGDVGEADLDAGTTNVSAVTLGATEATTDVDDVVDGTESPKGVVYDDKNADLRDHDRRASVQTGCLRRVSPFVRPGSG